MTTNLQTILIPLNSVELEETPRVKKLFYAYGEEEFIKKVLEKYFFDTEIGKIFAGGFPDWKFILEKKLKEEAAKKKK